MNIYRIASLTLVLALVAAGTSLAQPNTAVGLWRVTAFNDQAPGMNQLGTQTICVLPNGTWWSPSFGPSWNGKWFQKGANAAGIGDRARFLGNYAAGAGNDEGELDFVNASLMTGTWTEWRNVAPNHLFLWLRVKADRVGTTCQPPPPMTAAQAKAAAQDARNPMRQ